MIVKDIQLLDFLLDNTRVLQAGEFGDTVVHTFFTKRHFEYVPGAYARIVDRFLNKPGFDINATNQGGQTLLHEVASRGYDAAIRYLIARGAKYRR